MQFMCNAGAFGLANHFLMRCQLAQPLGGDPKLLVGKLQLCGALLHPRLKACVKVQDFALRPFALSDIAHAADQLTAPVQVKLRNPQVHGKKFAVAALGRHLAFHTDQVGLTGLRIPPQVGVELFGERLGHQHFHAPSDDLGRRIAEDFFGRRVERLHHSPAIDGDDRVANGLQGDFGALLFIGQRFQGHPQGAQRINAQHQQHHGAQKQSQQAHQSGFKQQGPHVAHYFKTADDVARLHQVGFARDC